MRAITGVLDANAPQIVTVRTPLDLPADPGEDSEPGEQRLHAADEFLADHVEGDERGALAGGHVTLRLEQAAQVGRNDRQRRAEQARRHAHVDATSP
jgi:hypothetical protein